MNKFLFKEGDLVYNLRKDGNIYVVINNYFSKIQKSKEEYPLGIQYSDGSYESFTIDGRYQKHQHVPNIVHANQENYEYLKKYLGYNLESPTDFKRKKKPVDIVRHFISKYGYAWCGASIDSQDDSIEMTKNTLVKIVEINTSDSCIKFVDQSGEYWDFVTPYDLLKGKPILID